MVSHSSSDSAGVNPAVRALVTLCAALLALCAPFPAHAVLGGDEADLPSDAANARMELRAVIASQTRFRVHEMKDPARNVRVRQFANRDGKIFGVAWDGPVKPDLSLALGPYFDRYQATVQAGGRVHGVRQVHAAGLEVRLSGHMRHFSGAAWAPNLVPTDVDPGVVR